MSQTIDNNRWQFELVGGQEGEPEDIDTMPRDTCVELVGGSEGEPESDYFDAAQAPDQPLSRNGEIALLNGSTISEAVTLASNADQGAGYVSYDGHRVVAGIPYDLERIISMGNARSNDLTGQMRVGDAIDYIRSSESKEVLDEAQEWAAEAQLELSNIISDFQKNGAFRFERTRCFKSLRFDQKKSLMQELTNVLKGTNTPDNRTIEKSLKAIVWRLAKATKLPAFTWSGKFGTRNNNGLVTASGLMCVDLDKVEGDIDLHLANMRGDPLIFGAARSPSGTGVKLLFRIPDNAAFDAKAYLACFETVERYIRARYPEVSLSVDGQAKAVAQLCFLMHDPGARCNPDSYILYPDEDLVAAPAARTKVKASAPAGNADAPAGPPRDSRGYPFDAYPPEKQWETVRSAVESFEDCLASLPDGVGERNKYWTQIGYAVGDWLKQIDDDGLRDEVREWLLNLAAKYYPGNDGCVERAMNGSNGACGLGTLFKLAKEMGNWTPPWTADGENSSSQYGGNLIDYVHELQRQVPQIKCVRDRWYAEENGLWRPVEQEIYQPVALAVLPSKVRSRRRASEVMATLQMQQQIPRHLLKTASVWEDESHQAVLLNCKNGLLRVTASEVQLMPHDPDKHYFTGQLAAAYDLNARDDTFGLVLFEAQPDKNVRKVLDWWFGYILYPGLRFRLALVNLGASTTGKSTIWEYGIGAVTGRDLTKNLSLSDICAANGYSIPSLQHSLLNVGGELDADELGQSSRFKLLVGGEGLEVRSIYGRPFTMRDYVAKLVFLTNHLPRFRSGTDAELRRIQFVSWKHVPAEPDPNLLDMVARDKDGVLTRRMVPALQQILGGAEPPPDDRTIRNEFAVRNDPMKVFLETYCIMYPDARLKKTDFRRVFGYFVDQADLPSKLKDENICGKLLKERTYGKVSDIRVRQAGVRVHFYGGVKLKPGIEDEFSEDVGPEST
jgi:hypothetical protein